MKYERKMQLKYQNEKYKKSTNIHLYNHVKNITSLNNK